MNDQELLIPEGMQVVDYLELHDKSLAKTEELMLTLVQPKDVDLMRKLLEVYRITVKRKTLGPIPIVKAQP